MKIRFSFRKVHALVLIALVVGCGVLYFFNPVDYGFYPRCPMYMATGWSCAGCGTLRGIHCLLHGEFGKALTFNPFLPVLVAFFLLFGFVPRIAQSVAWPLGFLAVSLVYTVVRNIWGF